MFNKHDATNMTVSWGSMVLPLPTVRWLIYYYLLNFYSLHLAITEYKNGYPFHSITFFMPWRLRLCVCYVIS